LASCVFNKAFFFSFFELKILWNFMRGKNPLVCLDHLHQCSVCDSKQ
jgi:hypothetical protein